MFVRAFYIYIMNIPFPSLFHLILFLISIILLQTISIYKREYSFPPLPFAPHLSYLSFVYPYTLLLYTLYIERNILSRNFLFFSRPFPYFYYTPYIYRMIYTFPAPFYPSYKVNTFSTATFFIFLKCYLWEKFAGKSF